jgi:hypothetical protein
MKKLLATAVVVLAASSSFGPAAAQSAAASSAPTSPAKKALVQRLLTLQQGDIESFARSIVERPAVQMMREAGMALQQQATTQEKREASAKAIEGEVKKYIEDAYPIVRERAIKLAPTTIGTTFESKMTEEELKLLVNWLESPTNKKYQQISLELRNVFSQRLLGEMPGVLDSKLQALDGRIRVILGVPPLGAGATAPAPAARPASK